MGGGGQTQKTDNSPWVGQQPYLTKGFSEAERLYESGPQQFFPGQTYTDMDPTRSAGLFGAANLASSGNPIASNAANYASGMLAGNDPYAQITGMTDTASGASLNGNPWLDQQYDLAAGKLKDDWSNTVMPGIAAQFGQSGGAGSTMHEELAARAGGELGDSLARLGSDIYGGNYQRERDRQTAAQTNLYNTGTSARNNLALNADTIRGAQFGDFSRLQDVGKEYEAQAGKELEDAINRFNFAQNAPYAALQDYMSMISGNYGGTSTTRSSGGSGAMQGIGGALAMMSLFSDVRLKGEIHHIATVNDAVFGRPINLYTYRYTPKAQRAYFLPNAVQVGVIAQEVQKVRPDCVVEDVSGYLKVDYGRLFKQPASVEAV